MRGGCAGLPCEPWRQAELGGGERLEQELRGRARVVDEGQRAARPGPGHVGETALLLEGPLGLHPFGDRAGAYEARAPLLAIIPLLTVFVALEVALRLLGLLSEAGHLNLYQGVRLYVTVVGYGAGVDYCLFVIARSKKS